MAHNSSKPADAKVVKPLTNLTEVRTKNKVLRVRFLGQNLPNKFKEVGVNCESASAPGASCRDGERTVQPAASLAVH